MKLFERIAPWLFSILVAGQAALWFCTGYSWCDMRLKADVKETWSAWSAPETVHPTEPFPTWVVRQYRTNLSNGKIEIRVLEHGSARTMFEPQIVTVEKP